MVFDLSTIDLSHSRVRCNGRVLGKCSLSSLIREINSRLGITWLTATDIYWDSFKYSELKDTLIFKLNDLNI